MASADNRRSAGSYGLVAEDLSSGSTHITGRNLGSYGEVGEDIREITTYELIHITDRVEGSYGVYGQTTPGAGVAFSSERTAGSYGTGGLKSIVTLTAAGATVISDRTSATYGAK